MKRIIILLAGVMFLSVSCGIHSGLTSNVNQNTTEVVLGQANYKVVQQVKGEAQALFIFGFGGVSQKALIAQARDNMIRSANMVGHPRAVINESVEIHHGHFPFVRTYTVTVWGYVIEFEK